MQMKLEGNASRLEAHIFHISNAQMLKEYLLTEDEKIKSDIEDFFIKVMEYNTLPRLPTFDQIRILDMNGM